MQTATTRHGAHDQNLGASVDSFFARFGERFNAFIDRLSRVDEVDRLNALSDAQLREIGLRREDIVRHVFRDKLYA